MTEQASVQPSTNVTPSFLAQLEQRWQQDHFVCVGLDPDYALIPAFLKQDVPVAEAVFAFNRAIIDATSDLVCAYKPNSAFYEALGADGLQALVRTVQYIKEQYPRVPVILDAKRADIGNTNMGYVTSTFEVIGADAITVHPYLGKEALQPFLARKEQGIFVLARTSNSGAGEFQDLSVGPAGEPLYQVVARRVAQDWNSQGNCALVVGATYPAELARVRAIVGDMPILVPGIGAQGGDVDAIVKVGQDSRGWGMIISSSRNIIFASSGPDFAEAACSATVQLHAEINRARS
ncbi:MAG TPA: orotidine-5'-phosphate decarboxylase [Ktedonobacteraceae bacterium]|jgi:orotidine-5'-phosphate decarboxylase|nr:orotidine-5'-phosphate decarboxylase [Ktedonobacteraceae bacterium]